MIWTWANDPTVRAASFQPDPIPWEDHVRWFTRKLADERCVFYVASDDRGRPIGQVRFDLEDDRAVVSVSLAREARGQGYGSKVLREACRQYFASGPRPPVHAWVKEGNDDSLRLFSQLGFFERSRERVCGSGAVHLVLEEHARR